MMIFIAEHLNRALCHPGLQQRAFYFLRCVVSSARCTFGVLSLVLAFAISGCVAHRPDLPVLPPIASAMELLHLTATRYDSLRDQAMRAAIDLTIDGVRERRAYALVRHRSPSDLKLVVGSLGTVVMAARAQNDTLCVYLPRENHYLAGHPEDVLYTLTGVDLSYYAYDRALLGLPSLSPRDAPYATRFKPGREYIFLELHHASYVRRVWIEARTGLLREEKVYNANGQLVSARRLSNYRSENGFALPRRIEIQQGEDVILIQVQSRTINAGLSDKDFDLPVPKDATRHHIGQ